MKVVHVGLKNSEFEIDLEIDEYGKTLMMCPDCRTTIEVAFNNIIDELYSLEESIICPFCEITLNRVHSLDERN